ncbi:MAG: hypothetical protein J6X35_05470 [Bacteroidales bacterium]|nr:hypothetical protein [Bacteroidales bacterium]
MTINGLKTLLVVFIAILFTNCSRHKIPDAIIKAIDISDGDYTIKEHKNDIVKVIDWYKSQQGTNYTIYIVLYEVTDTANSSIFVRTAVYEYDNKSKIEIGYPYKHFKISEVTPRRRKAIK